MTEREPEGVFVRKNPSHDSLFVQHADIHSLTSKKKRSASIFQIRGDSSREKKIFSLEQFSTFCAFFGGMTTNAVAVSVSFDLLRDTSDTLVFQNYGHFILQTI